ncbi:unnamed protein product [Mytilus edulis]|uniref:B box-type domain-containing protein n=1 Tax=Mytilus edulis TaxID=6550 RepID=A0A8S3S9A9_MYTED|nr:unnamed protein product [Mytilus edulis]
MASDWSNCAVCDHRQVTKPSVVWCSECDEGLCGDCNEHHSISRSSRNHETVSIAEFKKLPKEILQIATVCKIHKEKYELFCRKHDCPCCKKCVKSHNDCKKSDTTNRANISCQFTKSLAQITASVQKFGEINVSCEPCNLSIKKRKQKQAQIMVAIPAKNIDNLTWTLLKRINTELSNIQGCSLLPDARMVFACYKQDKTIIFKADGSKDFEIDNIGSSFDVTFIGDDCIAVTSTNKKMINIIDTNNKKLKKTIEVTSAIDGVAYIEGHLIYCAREKGLQMISLSDESITNVSNVKLPTWAYVTTFGDKLFYTDNSNNSVTCCDYHGNILWTFCDTSVLVYPLGISVDNDGNVFVVGCSTKNVVVISSDGQRCRQLFIT